ncbi:unnamed protein product, partial [Discosporangium mesarthrocarpum]
QDAAGSAGRDRDGGVGGGGGQEDVGGEGEKFMLPSWHYLLLSGRQFKLDFQWSGLDLLLLQDPRASFNHGGGTNVLALRSSGRLDVSSSGAGENISASLSDACLLPCVYAGAGAGAGAGAVACDG